MGYWDEETDLNILKQSLTLSKFGGLFVMHTANRDTLIRRFQARDFSFGDDGLVVLMERELDLESSRMINFWSYYRRDGEDLRFLNRMEINHRVYSLHELRNQFEDAGWRARAFTRLELMKEAEVDVIIYNLNALHSVLERL